MGIQGPRVEKFCSSPDSVDAQLASDHLSHMCHEEMKELEFSTGESDSVAIHIDLVGPKVERNRTLFQYLNRRSGRPQSA